MTRRERLERKAEKRHEWAVSRTGKASAEWEKGDLREEKSGIPFGQPILVGHHSEGMHRGAIKPCGECHAESTRARRNERAP